MANGTERVLDPCCGSRMFWFDRDCEDVVFGDIREESHILCDGRSLRIVPDVRLDVTSLPYPDGRFRLVVFDPPHIDNLGEKAWMALKYGRLPANWKEFLSKAFSECFRVLDSDGVLVFKWNEHRIKASEVLKLSPERPLFGQQMKKTHWYVFMKAKP